MEWRQTCERAIVSSAAKMAVVDPIESAKAARLRYLRDTSTGITRKRHGKGWQFFSADGKQIRTKSELQHIASLMIPPAWRKVWISPFANGHLQAVGYDARGRKQYRYHAAYSAIRSETKFGRLTAFARQLPQIRRRIRLDLSQPGLSKEKVLATVVRLLETTYIRIGKEEYAKENKSFGLTTLKSRHVSVNGATIRFHFRGKSGQEHEVELHDRRLATIVRNCHDLPGCELFQYVDENGARHCVNSEDVNGYIQAAAGDGFSAKDFRTWAGTFLATQKLAQAVLAETETAAKQTLVATVKEVAASLGNRPATCRKYYIHPVVMESYSNGKLFEWVKPGGSVSEVRVRKLIEYLAR
jgi:DNA topoisomerase-1